VQIGEILLRPRRAVQRLHVGGQLDEITGNESRREAHVPQQLDQQPGGIAARPGEFGQRELGRLHAGLHADEVSDVAREFRVELDQPVDGAFALARDGAQVFLEPRLAAEHHEIRSEVAFVDTLVRERIGLRVRLEEEVERVEDRHLGDEVDLDAELVGLLLEHEPAEVVSFRILLPVDEVFGRRDLERVRKDARTAMRRRAQTDYLRPERNEPVVPIVRDVIECDMNGHAVILHRTPVREPRTKLRHFRPRGTTAMRGPPPAALI
jgi:hypothetical protein